MQKVNFREEIKLFDQYYKLINEVYGGKKNDLAIEARKRLTASDRYVKRIYRLDTKVSNFPSEYFSKYAPKQAPKRVIQQNKYDLRNLEEFTEYFYYTSHRFIKIVSKLPLIGKINNAGILNVRNNLLEHSDKEKSRILINSFSCGGINGPVIKGPRYSHQINKHRDPGVFPNAIKLKQILKIRLNKAIYELELINAEKLKISNRITTKRLTIVYKNRIS
ncbi:hypothetical protein A2Z22_03910 [Candidatus Woesebacteria bacterium RBG_16_34_12]|uniref:Uncharacterized protein n=1 Tax=Candidatus Woesebacteria bacterium RBG_16_34_12 TaxID=1802480 RepID=A0A1F7X9G9_9BACT|nr:MAG: hypothetical protein A2Z22_03910 [Candidatus Woesebacteria bacterium RBG_16_34_12]